MDMCDGHSWLAGILMFIWKSSNEVSIKPLVIKLPERSWHYPLL